MVSAAGEATTMMIDDTKPKLDFVRQRVSHGALCRTSCTKPKALAR